MRFRTSIQGVGFLLVLIMATGTARADDGQDNVKTFMQAKMQHAQQVLEGLALEDFDGIAKSSQELSLLSNAAQWQVLQTPEYVLRSAEFRRSADSLTKAAKEKNIDGATLHYMQMTLRCVECHKYVRSVREARWEDPVQLPD